MVECAWADGTESHGLSHQTLVETVYAIAKDHPLDQIEEFGLSLSLRTGMGELPKRCLSDPLTARFVADIQAY